MIFFGFSGAGKGACAESERSEDNSSVSALLCICSGRSSAFACVRLRSVGCSHPSVSSFFFSRQAFARSAAPSSRLGWRRSHPVRRSPSRVFPCIASRIEVTWQASISSAAATSSSSKFVSVPLRSVAFAPAFSIMKLKTTMTSAMDRPERRATTRHFGSVGMSSQRRTQWLMRAPPLRPSPRGPRQWLA